MDPLSDEMLQRVAGRFRILAEPTRLRLLMTLLRGEHTVTELVEATSLSQANVSKHLHVLREGRFVKRRKEGLYAHYSAVDPSVERLCEIMCDRLKTQAQEETALISAGS